jgi:hypothetical protein
MFIGQRVKYSLFVADSMTLKFLHRFSKNTRILTSTKVCLVDAELLHADRRTDSRTDTTKLVVAYSNFANAPKKSFRNTEI